MDDRQKTAAQEFREAFGLDAETRLIPVAPKLIGGGTFGMIEVKADPRYPETLAEVTITTGPSVRRD